MVHLRIAAPPDVAARALARLRETPSAFALTHLPGAVERPAGDLVLCEVAAEDASVVIADLRELGIDECGSIAIEPAAAVLGDVAEHAERVAAGAPADAVVWEGVERATSESAELSASFLAFMMAATLIAAVGILTDSQILIIGAMVVGPEFGPLAGLCVALVQRRLDLAARSLGALAAGFPLAIAASFAGTELLRAAGRGPDDLEHLARPATLFISHPNVYSVIVAVLAGVAGTLSLSTAKSGALVGVLISVTTIPAAANIGVAAAYRDGGQTGGAAAQLGINLACLALAGTATFALQRTLFARRRRAHRARTRRLRRG